MALEKLTQLFLRKQRNETDALIKKTQAFLKKETHSLSFIERKNVYDSTEERFLEASKEEPSSIFLSAVLLFDLVRVRKEAVKKIDKELGGEVALIAKSYEYTREKLDADQNDLLRHCYRTSLYLASVKIGAPAICAAILHELPVHTATTLSEIKNEFGDEIGDLIDKFGKIRVIKTANNVQFISHLREMVVAMAKDLRVIIIKMCSNIDRMRYYATFYPKEKLKEVATESMEILAPIANLLGIWELRWQLEDLAFEILLPEEYEKITERFDLDERKNRQKYIEKTKNILYKTAREAGIECSIDGRFKHFYSIYQKMKQKKRIFAKIGDVFALRVIVKTEDDCYRLLGIIHRLWRPKQKRIKDYIASPKNNNYRSLHTTVFGLNSRPTEFQIRTKEMDEVDNFGIAAHWYYKNPRKKTPAWMQDLLLKQQEYKNDEEFLSQFSSELLPNRIYVYTPKGDVVSLPAGATPVDFAYFIHTEIGNKCVSAIVNDAPVPLDHHLSTNDVVEIVLNREQAGPKADWLEFVKTASAKKHIEEYLNKFPVEHRFRL